MHEQSIVESLLRVALEHAKGAQAVRIVRINVVVGELSGAVDESMDFFFTFMSKNTIASEASLVFKHAPAQLHCRQCNKIFTAEKHNFQCPDCKEQQVDIVSGRELYVESLEVE
jgi:hydrogenase nickel incorporation protein HypA/HybF